MPDIGLFFFSIALLWSRYYKSIIIAASTPVWILGTRAMRKNEASLVCFCCGVCCSKYQAQLPLSEAEIISDKLGMSWPDFQTQYLDPAWPGIQTVLLKHQDGRCVFLEPQSDHRYFFCRIQSYKPAVCLSWEADFTKPDCREGLGRYWKLKFDAENRVTGDTADMANFNGFMKQIKVDFI